MTFLRKFFLAISATAALSLGAGHVLAGNGNNDGGDYAKCKPGYKLNSFNECVKKK